MTICYHTFDKTTDRITEGVLPHITGTYVSSGQFSICMSEAREKKYPEPGERSDGFQGNSVSPNSEVLDKVMEWLEVPTKDPFEITYVKGGMISSTADIKVWQLSDEFVKIKESEAMFASWKNKREITIHRDDLKEVYQACKKEVAKQAAEWKEWFDKPWEERQEIIKQWDVNRKK